jgi:DNA/RNA endonuclease YhcR with UshA esterase domain
MNAAAMLYCFQVRQSLAGNPVTVTGKIELYKGRPEIVISSPD